MFSAGGRFSSILVFMEGDLLVVFGVSQLEGELAQEDRSRFEDWLRRVGSCFKIRL